MLRRLIGHGRLINVGIILQQNDQKKEEPGKNGQDVKTQERPAYDSVGKYVKREFNQIERSKSGADEGLSETYRLIKEDVHCNITGWDRVKNIFSRSEYEEVSPNMTFIMNSAEAGGFFGFLLGGCREYAKAFNLFVLTNDTTKFFNANEAQRKLARVGLQAFLKGGLLTGPKLACYVGIFLLVQTIVSEYRGKNGIVEFPIAGAATTAAMKWNLGIRGMISGCVTGGLSGLLIGPLIYLILKINGLTVSDAKYMLYSLNKKRKELLLEENRRNSGTKYEWEKIYSEKTKHLPPGLTDEL